MAKYTLDVDLLSTEDATVVQVHGIRGVDTYEEVYVANGSAKRHPTDTDHPGVGRDLALARALVALADQYASRAANTLGGSVEVGGYEFSPTITTIHATGGAITVAEMLSSLDYSHYLPSPPFTTSLSVK